MALSFTGSYPAGLGLFRPDFYQPPVPIVATELRGFFMQHKWNNEVSHITNGYWYNSAAHAKVRIDETYDGALGSSLFDYAEMTDAGAVMNHQIIVSPSVGSEPSCFDDYVELPSFPLITTDLLQSANATFGGIVEEPFLGETQTWNFLYASFLPVIAYLDNHNPPILMGYDFWGEDKRTKVVTRFFAHQVGNITGEVFEDFPCPRNQNQDFKMRMKKS